MRKRLEEVIIVKKRPKTTPSIMNKGERKFKEKLKFVSLKS